MKKHLLIVGFAALSIAAAALPFSASAKSNGFDMRSINTPHCRAFGHLIAPGWLKKHDDHATTTSDCVIPFGIRKHPHASSTSATSTVPFSLRITDMRTDMASSSAVIRWHTNAAADSLVYYSTSTPVTVGATTTASVGSSAKVTNHEMSVSGLATSTTYYFLLKSTDANGHTATSSEFHLTTSSI